MQCATNLWTHRPAVPDRTGEADEARALLSSGRGDP